jgi:3-(methylthio)propionyl---CoA ligase
VFPGPALDGKSVYELIESERVSFAAGVPTVWQMLLGHLQAQDLKFSTLKRTVIGGSACPPAMINAFQQQYGVDVLHAWGMTEMSPLGTLCTLKNKHLSQSPEQQTAIRMKQGRSIFGVDMKIVDGNGKELPWDGKASGDLLVKGPWVVKEYFKGEGGDPLVPDARGRGWFPTGDVATIDPDGYLQITDRSKDVIKSGGEWISSIGIRRGSATWRSCLRRTRAAPRASPRRRASWRRSRENIAVAHPALALAACIGVAHPKWDERPIDVVFVETMPLGATGKILKTRLREQLEDYRLPTGTAA